MGENASGLWPVLAALAVVVLIVIALAIYLNRRKAASRREATELREQAKAEAPRLKDVESSAKQLRNEAALARQEATRAQEEADRAEGRAQALERRSEEAVLAARDERDAQTDTYLRAREIDPDAKD